MVPEILMASNLRKNLHMTFKTYKELCLGIKKNYAVLFCIRGEEEILHTEYMRLREKICKNHFLMEYHKVR